MTGSVARAGNDLEAPDAIARGKPDVGRRLQLGPAAGKLAVNDLLPRVDARVELGHEHLDRAAEALLERVERFLAPADRRRLTRMVLREEHHVPPSSAGGQQLAQDVSARV